MWAGGKNLFQQKGGPYVTRENPHPYPPGTCPETALPALHPWLVARGPGRARWLTSHVYQPDRAGPGQRQRG